MPKVKISGTALERVFDVLAYEGEGTEIGGVLCGTKDKVIESFERTEAEVEHISGTLYKPPEIEIKFKVDPEECRGRNLLGGWHSHYWDRTEQTTSHASEEDLKFFQQRQKKNPEWVDCIVAYDGVTCYKGKKEEVYKAFPDSWWRKFHEEGG